MFAVSKEQMQSMLASYGGRRGLSLNEWPQLFDKYLAPWLVKETGEIRAASGDRQLSRFLETVSKIEFLITAKNL